ncbi:MAG TPA: hypothetical protein ENI86_07080 [Acidimicrobiales bacterium]|nr:hypothetical protein [Acidimicrobiales bacterium]
MSTTETVTAREAVQMILTERSMTEPGFLERLVLDPQGTVAPIIAEVAQDDDLDLSDVAINVHIETPRTAHFVVKLDAGQDEVTGFAVRKGLSVGRFDVLRVAPPVRSAAAGEKYTEAYLCTSSGVCVCTGPDECTD